MRKVYDRVEWIFLKENSSETGLPVFMGFSNHEVCYYGIIFCLGERGRQRV